MNWRTRARCRYLHPEMFFPANTDKDGVEQAQRECAQCPVKAECLTEALKDSSLSGIWGGTTAARRDYIRKKRRAMRALRQGASAVSVGP